MKNMDFKELILRPQRRKYSSSTIREVEGFDTETKEGYARIAATSRGYWRIDDINDAIGFLTQRECRDSLNFFYNMGFDIEVLFKHSHDVLRQLSRGLAADVGGYECEYLPKKCLTIRDSSRHVWRYYDAAQFYETSLATAAQNYLGFKSESYDALKGIRGELFSRLSTENIGEYCRQDAELTKRLSELVMRSLFDMGVVPKHVYSCGYVAAEYSLRYGDFPTYFDVPRHVQELYFYAYRGGWFDTYKKGCFSNSCQWDVSSAYPYALYHLPDVRDGYWEPGIRRDSDVGVVIAEISGSIQTGQMLAMQEAGRNIYPTFNERRRVCLTLREYKRLSRVFRTVPILAYSFVEAEYARRPYQKIINRLYQIKKQSAKGSMQYLVAKRIMNSLYGKSAEITNKRIGKLFNPCYAAECTATTRCQLFDAIKGRERHVVSLLTDSIIFDSTQEMPSETGLGSWELVCDDSECLVLQTGVYQHRGKDPHSRGFSRKNNLFDACLDSKGVLINTKTTRPTHFKEAVIQGRLMDVGVFKESEKQVDVLSDYKRIWPTEFQARDLLDNQYSSLAVPVSVLTRTPSVPARLSR